MPDFRIKGERPTQVFGGYLPLFLDHGAAGVAKKP
jgi:hypothetical protein